MNNVAGGSSEVKWKDDIFVIRTLQADSGPASRVLEVAFAHFLRGELTWSMSTLLRRPEGVDFNSAWVSNLVQVCGISDSELDAAPRFESILEEKLSGNTTPVWVGHDLDAALNALARERAIAEDRLTKSLAQYVPVPSMLINLQHLAAQLHPVLGRGLPDMCRRYDVDMGKSTLDRAIATGKVLCAMNLPDRVDAMQRLLVTARAKFIKPRGPSGIDKISCGRVRSSKPW